MIRKAISGASFALGNLNTSSRRLTTLSSSRLSAHSSVCETDNPTPVSSPDITHKKILKDLENILVLPEIDLQSYDEVLKRSTKFYKPNSGLLNDLLERSSFQHFCDNLCDKTVKIHSYDAVTILVRLCKLQIHTINPLLVMRYWHRHIDTNMHILTFIQIEMLLVHVLEHLENTSWTETKKMALVRRIKSKILTENLTFKMSTSSIISAVNLMQAFGIVDERASGFFLNILVNQPLPNWLEIFRILEMLDHSLSGYEPLLKKVRENILQNIMYMSLPNLISILLSIRNKVYQGHLEFYDAKLIDAIVDRALWDSCDLDDGISIMYALSLMRHKHIPLLHYLMKLIGDSKKWNHRRRIPALFTYAVDINCEQDARYLLQKMMLDPKVVKYSRKTLMKVVYSMALIDHYDQDLLETLFAQVDLDFVNQNHKMKRLISIVKIFSPVFTIPNNTYPATPTPFLASVQNTFPKFLRDEQNVGVNDSASVDSSENAEKEKLKVFPLKSKLELIFGGPMYVLTNIKVKTRLPVDHAVIFRPGGYPVAINSNSSSDVDPIILRDVPIPRNGHIVLITSIPWIGYVKNTGEMTASFKCFEKCLDSLNYTSILVSQKEWSEMPDTEKVPWLMKRIRERCKHIFDDTA